MSEKKKIGALWKKRTQGGKDLWAGNVMIDGKKTQIAMFENCYKDAENQPDYVIYLDDYKPAAKPVRESTADEFPSAKEEDDGCPF
jgi:uncharacterized protein (DUF736 family)